MVGTLRRHLRRIRYYSASPQRTKWHGVIDAGLYVTFFLGFLAAFAADFIIERETIVAESHGQVHRDEAGRIMTRLVDSDQRRSWSGLDPVGEFDMQVIDRAAGWPLGAWLTEAPPRFELNIFAQGTSFEGDLASLEAAGASPDVIAALERQLRATPERFDQRLDEPTQWLWQRWLINAGMWWVLLYMLFMFALIPMRIGWVILHQSAANRKEALRQRGLCPRCGYDLRGLEFHARCPECGSLIT